MAMQIHFIHVDGGGAAVPIGGHGLAQGLAGDVEAMFAPLLQRLIAMQRSESNQHLVDECLNHNTVSRSAVCAPTETYTISL